MYSPIHYNELFEFAYQPTEHDAAGQMETIGPLHYCDVIMGAMASQITGLTIVYSTVYSGTDQMKYQSSASLAFVRGIHRWPVNSPHKWPVTRKMFPFDDVIVDCEYHFCHSSGNVTCLYASETSNINQLFTVIECWALRRCTQTNILLQWCTIL